MTQLTQPSISLKCVAKPHAEQAGFTLIEVMIVVAILGILAAIALPSYTQYVQKSRRADVRALLMENYQYMQRFYSANGSYSTGIGNSSNTPLLPYQKAPADAGAPVAYDIKLSASSNTAFTLEAVPTGTMKGDPCGTFTITNTGAKNVDGASYSVAQCWK